MGVGSKGISLFWQKNMEGLMEKTLFCVMFTSRDDWDSPTVVFVTATDRNKAYVAALKKIGFTEEEAEETRGEGDHDDVVIEVDDIIDEDYEPDYEPIEE